MMYKDGCPAAVLPDSAVKQLNVRSGYAELRIEESSKP